MGLKGGAELRPICRDVTQHPTRLLPQRLEGAGQDEGDEVRGGREDLDGRGEEKGEEAKGQAMKVYTGSLSSRGGRWVLWRGGTYALGLLVCPRRHVGQAPHHLQQTKNLLVLDHGTRYSISKNVGDFR